MARRTELRSLSSQTKDWKQKFLGALSKAGLKKPVADRLMYNRGLLEVWVGLLPKVGHPFWQRRLAIFADIRRAELALAAESARKYRVEDATQIDELDLTVRAYNTCDWAGLRSVGAILAQDSLPSEWKEEYAEGVREELRNLLIAGGVAEPRLPSWLTITP